MAEETENAKIPPLLIENFVENVARNMPDSRARLRRFYQYPAAGSVAAYLHNRYGPRHPRGRDDTYSGEAKLCGTPCGNISAFANCRKWIEYYYEGKGNIRITSKRGAGTVGLSALLSRRNGGRRMRLLIVDDEPIAIQEFCTA